MIFQDDDYLLFNSYGNPAGESGDDSYVATKTQSVWSKAKSIGKTASTKDEGNSRRFSIDGKYSFFSKAENLGNYEYGEWNFYYIETEYLKSLFN